jgi:hypothetical protein
MNSLLKIFVFHKPSSKGHVISIDDLKIHGLTDPQELADHGVCDLLTHPAVKAEILNSYGPCLSSEYSEENFEVTYYTEL